MRLALVAVLAGCVQTAPPPAVDDAAAFNRSLGGCRAEPVATLVGKQITPALLAKAKARARAAKVRLSAPGALVTADFRGDRLNIEIDAARRVVAAHCG